MGLEQFFRRYQEAVQRERPKPRPLDVLQQLGLQGSQNLVDETGNLTLEAINLLGDDLAEFLRLYGKLCQGLNCPKEIRRYTKMLIKDGNFSRLQELDNRRDPWANKNNLAKERLPVTMGNIIGRNVLRGPGRYRKNG